MSYRTANAASPANLSSSQGNLSKVCLECACDIAVQIMLNQKPQISYRNSPHSRPSPGSSPNNVPGLSANFDSNSSAPCSPSPLTTGNNGWVNEANYDQRGNLIDGECFRQFDTFTSVDSFYINPSIQQHFEQFSLVSIQCWCLMSEWASWTWTAIKCLIEWYKINKHKSKLHYSF